MKYIFDLKNCSKRDLSFPLRLVSIISSGLLKLGYQIKENNYVYLVSFPISLRAFLPSLSVFIINQDKKVKVSKESIINDINVGFK